MEELKIPNHVGIIMDGNGRWAKERGKKRSYGHLCGFNNLKKLSEYIFEKGVNVLSLYCFSTDNFKRDKEEVDYLMNLFITKCKELTKQKDVKIIFSGERQAPLPLEAIKMMEKIEKQTENNDKNILNLCINYGGQEEIVSATKKICSKILNNEMSLEDINIDNFNKYLYNELPPVDFLIRTSGELRVSNFMLWQISYSEFYFPETYFPDFDEKEFDKAILVYNNRDRRFGNAKK